jgi:glyoxylase-like metal-dependent hydrolase (beta-lactamase superfamily II)
VIQQDQRIYFRQLLAGRDFAQQDPAAKMMQNFVYLIGDRVTRECVIIDPAWGVEELVDLIESEGFTLVGALATHYHPDHIGGTMFGHTVEGLPALMARTPCKVHAHRLEVDGIMKVTGLSKSDIVAHDSGDHVKVGEVEIKLLHTPGHTPGSQCVCVGNALVSGDTLFLRGCGRVDLPGGDPNEMYYTLTQRIASLSGDLTLFPGHAYGGNEATLKDVRRDNPYLNIQDLATWRRVHGLF